MFVEPDTWEEEHVWAPVILRDKNEYMAGTTKSVNTKENKMPPMITMPNGLRLAPADRCRGCWGTRRANTLMRAGRQDETTQFLRNQSQATTTA
jgi:hypothetical protein